MNKYAVYYRAKDGTDGELFVHDISIYDAVRQAINKLGDKVLYVYRIVNCTEFTDIKEKETNND